MSNEADNTQLVLQIYPSRYDITYNYMLGLFTSTFSWYKRLKLLIQQLWQNCVDELYALSKRITYKVRENYARNMLHWNRIIVMVLCANAVVSATAGTVVLTGLYFYIALAFATVNLICSIFLFYGIVHRQFMLLLPYVFCICLNLGQCVYILKYIIMVEWRMKDRLQARLFLYYVLLWIMITPIQLAITFVYITNNLWRKAMSEPMSQKHEIVVERVKAEPPVRIPLQSSKNKLRTQNSVSFNIV